MKKACAEFIGTFTLVLLGCGSAVIAGPAVGATTVGVLGISLAFGLAIVAMAYGIGPVSGCHVNPAVSFGAFIAGRMSAGDLVTQSSPSASAPMAGDPATSVNTTFCRRRSSKSSRPSCFWSRYWA